MSFDYKFNITEDLKSGIDLYTQAGLKLAVISIGVTSSVTVSALQQQLAS